MSERPHFSGASLMALVVASGASAVSSGCDGPEVDDVNWGCSIVDNQGVDSDCGLGFMCKEDASPPAGGGTCVPLSALTASGPLMAGEPVGAHRVGFARLNRLSLRDGLTPCYQHIECERDGRCSAEPLEQCTGYRRP